MARRPTIPRSDDELTVRGTSAVDRSEVARCSRGPQSGRDGRPILPGDPLKIAMARGRDAESSCDVDDAITLTPARQGQRKGDDPTVLGAHTAQVKLDRPPHDDRACDVVPAGRRRGARAGVVPGVDAAGACRSRCRFVRMAAEKASRIQHRLLPQLITGDGLQAFLSQAPLAEADYRSDEVGRRRGLLLARAHRAGTGSSSGRTRGSAGGSAGNRGGSTGASIGSTTIRREGPGRLPRGGTT